MSHLRSAFIPILVVFLLPGVVVPVSAQSTVTRKIDIGVATVEQVRPILENSLTPEGRFVVLPGGRGVTVIDTPAGVLAAEQALAGADLPDPDVALDFEFVTGLPGRTTSITVGQEAPFPVEYAPPTIIVGPTGVSTVVPATPTKFATRNIGTTSETTTRRNPDGSLTVDVRSETTRFEGFVNYGSALLPAGAVGTIPVNGQVANPTFFTPFIDPGAIQFPILSTTRISTSVVVRPRVHLGAVHLDVMPRLTMEPEPAPESDREPESIDLKQFRTVVEIPEGEVGQVRGLAGADDRFNRHFFGAKNLEEGSTALRVRAALRPSGAASRAETEESDEKE